MNNKKFLDKIHLQTAADIIGRELGLNYPTNRLEELLRGFERTSELFQGKLSPEKLIEDIIKLNSIPNHLYTELSCALTINETYFFREAPAMNLFKTIIAKEVEISNGNYKIWSAGCSSGEEPFTLAILIKELLPAHIANNVKIIGTDLSDKALQKAHEGLYTQWSFRETPNNIRDKYFTPIKDKWQISDTIRKMVSFSHLNLITENYPNRAKGLHDINLIFCRNVLMYFSHSTIKEVAMKFYDSLCNGGWFVTSQVELNNDLFPCFDKAKVGEGFFYKREKPLTAKEMLEKTEKIRTTIDKASLIQKKRIVRDKSIHANILHTSKLRSKSINLPPINEVKKTTETSPLQAAREFANKGEYSKALTILEELTSTDSISLDFLYLYATIFSEQGDYEKAAEYYKKCIYINPSHILANYMLGNIYVELNKKELSLKYFRTALKQAIQLDPKQEVSDSGGIRAERIIEMLENLIN